MGELSKQSGYWDKYYKTKLDDIGWFIKEKDIPKIMEEYKIDAQFAEFIWRKTEGTVPVVEVLHIKDGMKVLEIGCGSGGYTAGILSYFSSTKFKMVAIDYSKSGITNAKYRLEKLSLNDRCQLIPSSALELPFHNDTFDIVICPSVIEHIPKQENVLMEMKRVCKSNGEIIISTDNKYSKLAIFDIHVFIGIIGKFLRKIGLLKTSQGYFIANTPEEFKNKLNKVGLKLSHFEFIHFGIPYFNSFLRLLKLLPVFLKHLLFQCLLFLEKKSQMSRKGRFHAMYVAVVRKFI